MSIKLRLNIINMSNYEITKSGLVISIKQKKIIIVGAKLYPSTIDVLDESIFLKIFENLTQNCTFLSFKLTNKSLYVYLGQMIKEMRLGSINEIFNKLKEDIKQFIPNNLNIEYLTGYKLPMNQLKDFKFRKKLLSNEFHFYKFYDLTELQTLNYHTKMLKVILEIPNSSISFTYDNIQSPNFHFGINIRNKKPKILESREETLSNNLRRSPYFSGKLIKISKRYIRNSPGKLLLGITPNTISKNEFYDFIKLLPNVIPKQSMISIPKFYPLINITDTIENKQNVKPIINIHQEKKLTPSQQKEGSSLKNKVINDFIEKLNKNKWKIKSRKPIGNNTLLIELENEKFNIVTKISIDNQFKVKYQLLDETRSSETIL